MSLTPIGTSTSMSIIQGPFLSDPLLDPAKGDDDDPSSGDESSTGDVWGNAYHAPWGNLDNDDYDSGY